MTLRAYIIRRTLLLIPTILGVIAITFLVLQLTPPGQRVASYSPSPIKVTPEAREALIKKHGLDQPFYTQFWYWLKDLSHGDLGYSQVGRAYVSEIILKKLPATAELAIFSFIVIMIGGIWLGEIAGVRRGKAVDHATRALAISGYSLPIFWLGLLLLLAFYSYLGLLPPGRLSPDVEIFVSTSPNFNSYTGFLVLDSILNGNSYVLIDALKHLLLPVFALGFGSWAALSRVMRSSMLEAISGDYIKTARMKGVSEKVLIKKHARRNALIPVVTMAGPIFATLLNGVPVTETIFFWPGLGRWGVEAAVHLETNSIIGFVFFTALLVCIANLVIDVLYGYIDPRVRYE